MGTSHMQCRAIYHAVCSVLLVLCTWCVSFYFMLYMRVVIILCSATYQYTDKIFYHSRIDCVCSFFVCVLTLVLFGSLYSVCICAPKTIIHISLLLFHIRSILGYWFVLCLSDTLMPHVYNVSVLLLVSYRHDQSCAYHVYLYTINHFTSHNT